MAIRGLKPDLEDFGYNGCMKMPSLHVETKHEPEKPLPPEQAMLVLEKLRPEWAIMNSYEFPQPVRRVLTVIRNPQS